MIDPDTFPTGFVVQSLHMLFLLFVCKNDSRLPAKNSTDRHSAVNALDPTKVGWQVGVDRTAGGENSDYLAVDRCLVQYQRLQWRVTLSDPHYFCLQKSWPLVNLKSLVSKNQTKYVPAGFPLVGGESCWIPV